MSNTDGSLFFDPRIIDEKKSNRMWSTHSVELALSATKQGVRLSESPFFSKSKDVLLRKANLPFEYTPEEREILLMIQDDILLWAKHFPSLKDGANGWRKITLRDYQIKLLKRYKEHLKNILLFPRQSGKTTTTVLDVTFAILTGIDSDILIVSSSDDVAGEVFQKIKECLASLPIYMQPGCISWSTSDGNASFDNGVRIRCKKASESVAQGFALDYLFVDEFAYIEPKVAQKFWNNVYPTLSANPKAKCIIASTPNGKNLFHTIWNNAIKGTSSFVPFRIHWTDVPRPDQEQYKKDVISDVGLTAWLMGYELSFDTSLSSVFDTKMQELLRKQQTKYQKCWSMDNHIYGYDWRMSFRNQETISTLIDEVEYNIEGIDYNFDTDFFIAGIDLAEGLEQDSTILKLRKCVWNKELKRIEYKTIGIFKEDDISVEDFATHTLPIFKRIKNIRVVLETNTYGAEYLLQVKHIITSKKMTDFDQFKFARFMEYQETSAEALSKNEYHIGVRWNRGNKPVGVKSYVNYIKTEIFDETHYDTIEEQLNFGKGSNGTYSAQYGHDDLILCDVSIAYWLQSGSMYVNTYLEDVETYLRFINNDRKQEVIDEENRLLEKEKNIYRIDDWVIRNAEEIEEKNNNKNCFML